MEGLMLVWHAEEDVVDEGKKEDLQEFRLGNPRSSFMEAVGVRHANVEDFLNLDLQHRSCGHVLLQVPREEADVVDVCVSTLVTHVPEGWHLRSVVVVVQAGSSNRGFQVHLVKLSSTREDFDLVEALGVADDEVDGVEVLHQQREVGSTQALPGLEVRLELVHRPGDELGHGVVGVVVLRQEALRQGEVHCSLVLASHIIGH